MNRLVPDSTQSPPWGPSPSRRADVRSPAGLDPASDSVSANEATWSPAARPGRKAFFCASDPNLAMTCPAMPLFVPNIDRNAGAA